MPKTKRFNLGSVVTTAEGPGIVYGAERGERVMLAVSGWGNDIGDVWARDVTGPYVSIEALQAGGFEADWDWLRARQNEAVQRGMKAERARERKEAKKHTISSYV